VNDGVFFMTVDDFKTYFEALIYNYDPTNWKLSYWMARGDGHLVGTPGIRSDCGSTCKLTKFIVVSPIAQTIYASVHVHTHRQYIQDPCF
jgi:hypothetical protein